MEPIACSCASMAWTAPTIIETSVNIDASETPTLNVPASDDSAKTTDANFGACFETGGDGCVTTGSYAAEADFRYKKVGGSYDLISNSASGWISFSGSTLTVAPTDPALVGTYLIAATYTPTSSGTASEF